MKRKNLVLVYLIALFACFAFCLSAAAASGRPYFPSTITLITSRDFKCIDEDHWKIKLLPGNLKQTTSFKVGLDNDYRKMKIYNIKSSKPKVISADKHHYVNESTIELTYENPGSSTLSFNVKVEGRSYSYNVKVKVLKYTNPLKKITFGSKDLTSKFNKSNEIMLAPIGGKFNVIPKNGWKISLIINRKYNGDVEIIKNGQTTRFGSGHIIEIRLENPRLNLYQSLEINWKWK